MPELATPACGSPNVLSEPKDLWELTGPAYLTLYGGGAIVDDKGIGISFSGPLLKLRVQDRGIVIGERWQWIAWITSSWLWLCEASGFTFASKLNTSQGKLVMWSAKWEEIVRAVRSPNAIVLWKRDGSGVRFAQLLTSRLTRLDDMLIYNGLHLEYVSSTFRWRRTRPIP